MAVKCKAPSQHSLRFGGLYVFSLCRCCSSPTKPTLLQQRMMIYIAFIKTIITTLLSSLIFIMSDQCSTEYRAAIVDMPQSELID